MSKFVEKKHLVRAPTLLIGVGGIGGQIVKYVNDNMSDYDKSCVKMVVMDTDTNALDNFVGSDIPYIQTSENQTVQAYLSANDEFLEWFPTDPFINSKSLINGAGQIRSVSRLGALASKADGKFDKIRTAVDEVLRNQGSALTRAVRVMIVGSVTGGTGSGLGVQLPFYVRKVLKDANIPNVLIRGLFLMPSLTEDFQKTEAMKRAVNVNGYAFLKELNAFYHAQVLEEGDNKLRIEEYVPGKARVEGGKQDIKTAAMVPYDFLYLVEKRSNQGIIGDLPEYIKRTSQIVMNQLFSPISNQGYSSEDNLITSIVPQGGMNRYCGAGVSNAIYPKDEIVRYCTVRYAQQLINEYWLTIDNEFKKRDERQRRLKKNDPGVMALEKSVAYCQIFDDICDPTKRDVASEIAELHNELSVQITSEEGKISSIPLIDIIMGDIENHIDEAFAKTNLYSDASACELTAGEKSDPQDLATDITNKMQELRILKDSADKKVSDLIGSVAQDILPADIKSAQDYSKGANFNVYVAIGQTHPIITRYLMYLLLNKLNKAKKDTDSKLDGQRMYVSIFNKDYYEEGKAGEHKESPTEAINKIKKGILAHFNVYSSEYKTFVSTLRDDVSGEANHILDVSKCTLKSNVYRTVIERLEVLIDLYEKFFDELKVITESKAKEEKALEKGRGEGENNAFAGDRYVCANAKCKKYLYDEFMHRVTDAELQMSEEVKKSFFDKMYEEYENLLTEKESPSTIIAHISYRDMFENGILQPIVKQFEKGGFKHLDMGILDAIHLEYRIEKNAVDEDKDSTGFADYFRALCSTLTTLAEPYMLYDRNVADYNAGGITSYAWGLNHATVADFQLGDPNADDIDESKLGKLFGDRPLVDDSFSPYTMVCYASIYDLRIENCISYRRGTRAEKCYAERLNNLVNRESFVLSTSRDNEIDVIHPHLDRRWHEHAFLPELMGYDDDQMCKDIRLAFLLSMALGRCKHINNEFECIECWCYKNVTGADREILQPIRVMGKELKAGSVLALYEAFDYNRAMVSNAIEYAETVKISAKEDCAFDGVTDKTIMQQTIIKGLVDTGSKVGKSIIDVLYTLYKNSANRTITCNLLGTLDAYVYDYCMFMLNNNENRAKTFSQKIMREIGEASECLKDAATSEFFKEDVFAFIKLDDATK